MHLTAFSDYTLRTLIYLALRPDSLCTIEEIATAYDISTNHLTKVVHQAARAGEVVTVRGQGGGLRLARKPASINVGAVLRRTEPDFDIVPCFRLRRRLRHSPGLCAARGFGGRSCGVPRRTGSHEPR